MRGRKGMTLVELIVVIGLIAFIATVLIFPTFHRARERTYEEVCKSNLRQIGFALLMYAEDWHYIPPHCNVERPRLWKRAFAPYIRNDAVFFCPADPFVGLPSWKIPPPYPNLPHDITSYGACMTPIVSAGLYIDEMFREGYYLTTDIYYNIANFPQKWLYAPYFNIPPSWRILALRLHSGAIVYAICGSHIDHDIKVPMAVPARKRVELYCDGSVHLHSDSRPCYMWRELVEYFKPKEGDRK